MLRYAITDRSRLGLSEAERARALVACATRWAASGVDLIQLREPDLAARDLLALAIRLKQAIQATGAPTRLLINSRADIALAAALDGVHLTSRPDTFTPQHIRTLFHARSAPPTVSISCHTLHELRRATALRADLILFGPVFGKEAFGKQIAATQLSAPLGLKALAAACALAAPTPVLALGSITHENTPACLEAGAAGIAAIRLFIPASHPSA